MNVKGVDFIFYNVSDMKKAVEFYRDVLGLKPLEEPGETWAEFNVGNATLSIGVYGSKATGPKDNVSVALSVDDVKESVAYLREKGVPVVQDTFESGGCFMAIATDPDGNQVILHHRKDGTVG
ncbi:MAG TPA: VOC family protein [Candidatus Paceibacterota bacterium]